MNDQSDSTEYRFTIFLLDSQYGIATGGNSDEMDLNTETMEELRAKSKLTINSVSNTGLVVVSGFEGAINFDIMVDHETMPFEVVTQRDDLAYCQLTQLVQGQFIHLASASDKVLRRSLIEDQRNLRQLQT